MYKNIVFDVGNVIVDEGADRLTTIRPIAEGCENKSEFNAMLSNMLLGNLTVAQCAAIIRSRGVVDPAKLDEMLTMDWMLSKLPPLPGTLRLLDYLRDDGYRIYFLSNATDLMLDYVQECLGIPDDYDGGVFSCEVGLMKPDLRVFQLVLDGYDLDPRETIFFDDNERNVRAARMCGMSAEVFCSTEDVHRALHTVYWV